MCRKIRDLAWYAQKNRDLIRLGYRASSSLEIRDAGLGNGAVVAEAFPGSRTAIVAANIGRCFDRCEAASTTGAPGSRHFAGPRGGCVRVSADVAVRATGVFVCFVQMQGASQRVAEKTLFFRLHSAAIWQHIRVFLCFAN
ncbi:hypothetical protein C9I56_02990 [Paraburkholderia caribensis]|uniref:hypothetical protein n=1 Tax=Paraburkholderia caribensis TaxID=75105 RepID=UPI000D150E7D|nr:hypothetical protein [Paraburkholderia caribensis]PTB30343.1 hypothetical protein C9I56_02990 [Paraburkholderia caribensis]